MLDAVRFAAAAVAKREYVPGLTHFRIAGGRITGHNGVMSLSTPVGVDLDVRPRAAGLLAAVRACEGPIALHVTPAGRLAVRAGAFRAYVECIADDDGVAPPEPKGEDVELGPSFLAGLRALEPVMGVDASRPWSCGIKVASKSMYATNNVVAAQFWHGSPFPVDVVIPEGAIDELLRIGDPPVRVQVCDHSLTFHFDGERMLTTTVLDGGSWPIERVDAVLDTAGPVTDLPDGFFEAVAKLKPFAGDAGAIFVAPAGLSTSLAEGDGASIELAIPGLNHVQSFNHRQLAILSSIATGLDWSAYPKPTAFAHRGLPLRGVVAGQRM